MKKLICFLFCCLGVWARDVQESKHQFVDENKSFSENLKNLNIPDSFKLEEIVIGDESAPHTLVIYSSFSCGHCRKFHKEELPELKKQYVDSGKLKVILHNYIDDLGALEAAILMRIFYNKSKDAIGLYNVIFDSQKDWMKSKNPREFLKQIFVKAGYDSKAAAEYLDTNNQEYKRISAGLMKEQQRAMHVLKISSVPAFILDGRVHQGILTCEEIVEKLGIAPKRKTAEH
ncbi:MAG: DsbA family protein [Alphaproteobacteria bacterium]|nr:DsbA family protein [Alphaproteobacteria bacterium]